MHRPRKRFGQNFLVDPLTIHALIVAIAPRPDEAILEVGPGLGALTKPLLDKVEHLEVIEIDRDLIRKLETLDPTNSNLTIYQRDALKFDFSAAKKIRRIVGNLPYNISTPLIFHLLSHLDYIKDMHFMLQKEVVDRICANTGSRVYGRLSVMIQARCFPEKLLEIDAEKFSPQPKITSGFIRLTPLLDRSVSIALESTFVSIVKSAFSQPRKTLANNLKGQFTSDEIEKLEIDPFIRPQHLGITEFVRLAQSKKN